MKYLFRLIEFMREVLRYFVMIYIWIASCIYLYSSVSVETGNYCFYGGLAWLGLTGILAFKNIVRKNDRT